MDIFHAVILGIVEGISEFLPISSTGHLILASNLLGIKSSEFVKSFEIVIQTGAILAVVALYARDIMTKKHMWGKILAAFIPTGIIGFFLYKTIKQHLLGNSDVVLWSLFLGGIALIAIEFALKRHKGPEKNMSQVTYRDAIIIGIIQSISVIPGVSRAAATIFGGMAMGMDRKTAVEFSFILAIPTMLAATTLDLAKTSFSFTTSEWTALGVGFITSYLVAILSIKWLVSYVKNYSFIPFGWYRIAIAIFLAGLFYFR